MKKIIKRSLILFASLILILIAVGGVYIYNFDSGIKGDYYFKIATEIDENNPQGSGEALRYYHKAIKSYVNSNNKTAAVEAYINLALLHYKFGNILQVERNVLKALEMGKDNIDERMQAKVYLLLASTLEPEKARRYIDKSLAISKKHNLVALTTEAYFLLAKSNEYKAEFEEAEKNYLRAIDALENSTSIDSVYNAGFIYERLAELYAGGGQTDKAINYYQEALTYYLHEERGFLTANYMKIIGDLYEEKSNHAKACEMWGKSEEEYAYFGAVAPFKMSDLNNHESCNGHVG